MIKMKNNSLEFFMMINAYQVPHGVPSFTYSLCKYIRLANTLSGRTRIAFNDKSL